MGGQVKFLPSGVPTTPPVYVFLSEETTCTHTQIANPPPGRTSGLGRQLGCGDLSPNPNLHWEEDSFNPFTNSKCRKFLFFIFGKQTS